MKKALIVIVVLVLLGGGGYLVWSMMDTDTQNGALEETENETVDQEATEAEATNEVSYTDSGFEPATITVDAGTEVTWTNDSGSDMWVASDPHPVHTDFGEFDQKQSGDSYSFTFDEAGTYEYHNHQNSGDTGTVIVK